MTETKINANRAVKTAAALTLFIAAAQMFMAYMNYRDGMNVFDITSYVTSNRYFYCIMLIIANLVLLPCSVMLYKENGIKLKDEIFDTKTLGRDILYGLAALLMTEIIGLVYGLPVQKFRTELAYSGDAPSGISYIILEFLALTVVSGICKEIVFRGLAKRFAAPVLGEMTAFILFNMMFAILDWHNLGYSFLIGLAWIWSYKKSGHLISPMIAHGGANFAYLVYRLAVSGGI